MYHLYPPWDESLLEWEIYWGRVLIRENTVFTFRGIKCTCNDFQWQEDKDAQQIEHIVDSRSSESSSELVLVADLSDSYDGVGNTCTDIRTHRHRDRRTYCQHLKFIKER